MPKISPVQGFRAPAALVWSLASALAGILKGATPPDSLTFPPMALTVDALVAGSDSRSAPLLRPAALVKGDTIGIVAPSSSPREGWLTRGTKALERAGFQVLLDSEILAFRRFRRMED